MDYELNFGKRRRRRSPKRKAVMQIRIKNRNRKLYSGNRGGLYYKRSNGTKVYIDPRNTSIIRSPRRRRGRGAHNRLAFGNTNLLGPGQPSLKTPIELVTGRTYPNLRRHYLNTPLSFLSGNFPPNVRYSGASYGKDSSFGNTNLLGPGQPSLKTPIELVTGRTYPNLKKHYLNTPLSFLSGNFPPNVRYSGAAYGKDSSFGKKRNSRNNFGQYFR